MLAQMLVLDSHNIFKEKIMYISGIAVMSTLFLHIYSVSVIITIKLIFVS